MRFLALALTLSVPLTGACASDEPDAARKPAPRVATSSPEPPRAVEGEAPGPQPRPAAGSKKDAAGLCKALSEIPSEEDPDEYLTALRDEAAKAGFGFERLIAAVQRALAADDLEKAGKLYARLGTLCEDVVGRRNF